MKRSTKTLLSLNRIFKKPVHPFNLQNDGKLTYAQWQFEKGADTLTHYLDFCTRYEMFEGKDVLDIGCGAAGKSLYYAAQGAKSVTGVDVLPEYREEAYALAREKGLEDQFKFIVADASHLPLPDARFDTILMNDAFEHVADPGGVLTECMRVLKKGGRLFCNFPPYHHPFGAHLSDAIGIPWVHLFFSEATLIEAYKELVAPLPDGKQRISFRISKDETGHEYFSYINKMTMKRAKKVLESINLTPIYYHEVPLRKFLSPLCHIPGLKEGFVKMVVMVFEKGTLDAS